MNSRGCISVDPRTPLCYNRPERLVGLWFLATARKYLSRWFGKPRQQESIYAVQDPTRLRPTG